MALFKFNNGEVKDLDKPLANVLQTRKAGVILPYGSEKKELKTVRADKTDKRVNRRSNKKAK